MTNNYYNLFILASAIEAIALAYAETGRDITAMPIDDDDNDVLFELHGYSIKFLEIDMKDVWNQASELTSALFNCLNEKVIDLRPLVSAAQNLKIVTIKNLDPEDTVKGFKECLSLETLLSEITQG